MNAPNITTAYGFGWNGLVLCQIVSDCVSRFHFFIIFSLHPQAECLWAMAESRGLVSSPDDALDAADEAMDLFLELRDT